MNQANKNFVTNILHLVANIIVGIIYTPYLVRNLGMTVYGVVPLALIINQYIGVLSLSLVNALTRFYSVEYRKGNMEKASKYFSTAVTICIILSIVAYPILELLILNIDYVFEIPEDLLNSTIWLFRFIIISFLLSIISTCINSTLYADNNLADINYIKIVRQCSKLLMNVGLFVLFATDIFYVGLANLVSEILVLIMSIYYYQKKKPFGIYYRLRWFDTAYLYTMLGMIVWVMLQRLADTFLYKVDSIIMNEYFGINFTGIIGAISEFGSYVISISAVLSSLLGPLLLIHYSKSDMAAYKKASVNGSYIIGLVTALLSGLLIGTGSQILSLWLGVEYAVYDSWLAIKLLVVPFTSMGAVYASGYLNANKNKYPAIMSVLLSILNVAFIVGFLSISHSVLTFLLICMLFIMLQGYFMNVWFYSKIYNDKNKEILVNTFKIILFLSLVILFAYGFSLIFVSVNIYILMIFYLVAVLMFIVIMDLFFLNGNQKAFLFELMPIYKKIRSSVLLVLMNK